MFQPSAPNFLLSWKAQPTDRQTERKEHFSEMVRLITLNIHALNDKDKEKGHTLWQVGRFMVQRLFCSSNSTPIGCADFQELFHSDSGTEDYFCQKYFSEMKRTFSVRFDRTQACHTKFPSRLRSPIPSTTLCRQPDLNTLLTIPLLFITWLTPLLIWTLFNFDSFPWWLSMRIDKMEMNVQGNSYFAGV